MRRLMRNSCGRKWDSCMNTESRRSRHRTPSLLLIVKMDFTLCLCFRCVSDATMTQEQVGGRCGVVIAAVAMCPHRERQESKRTRST